MKINNAKFYKESKPVFIDLSSSGITEKQFNEIVEAIRDMQEDDRKQIKEAYLQVKQAGENERNGITDKIKAILTKHGLPIAHSLTGSGIFELCKYIFK